MSAVRCSPRIAFVAPVRTGDETVWFRDADGTGYVLSLISLVSSCPAKAPHRSCRFYTALAWKL